MTDEHATDTHTDDVKKHLKTYIGVFVALIVLTVVTVEARNLALGVSLSIAVAMLIATVKGSLVGAFFMHLAWEKKTIYALLVLAGAFVFFMMGLLVWSLGSPIEGTSKAPIEAVTTDHPPAEGH